MFEEERLKPQTILISIKCQLDIDHNQDLDNIENVTSYSDIKNEIIKFEQIDIDLRNLENTTIKQPKIQETSTLRLFSCIYNKFSKDPICKGGFNEEILPTLNRRMVLPLFIPVITLISSLLFIKTSGRIYYSKVSIFCYDKNTGSKTFLEGQGFSVTKTIDVS